MAVSAISCWEVAYLAKRGKLDLRRDTKLWIDAALGGSGVACIEVDRTVATLAADLPDHHRDPADRLIIATTIERRCNLISFDDKFRLYEQIATQLLTG